MLSLLCLLLFSCKGENIRKKTEKTVSVNDPFDFRHYPQQKYSPVEFGQIKPKGWIADQIKSDLNGFTGHLDELAPEIILNDDIYGEDRRTNFTEGTDVSPNALAWWNSESQSNWWDGFIRSAILTEDQNYLYRVEDYVRQKLNTQEEDGYLGIYQEDLRFQKEGENAEFWAQTTLLRGLLAVFHAYDDPEILKAVEDAVQRSMEAYPAENSTPFKKPGVGHSLVLTDILDRLYQITGKKEYLDYALWLYKNFNQNRNTPENVLAPDILLENILDPNYRFKGHGVHTYELFRSLVTAYYASGNPILKQAIDAYLKKIDYVTSPSGGPAGDEWIGGRSANPTKVGYEYCSIHELLDSYSFLMQKNGNMALADKMEWLLFNAGQGARLPGGAGIAYCKTDNSYSMTGPLHLNGETQELRYKYSPVHQDVAVCCAPNAGRIYPYYVKSMWLRKEKGLLAALYGPSTLRTSVNGVDVKINQETKYPFENTIRFIIAPEEPVAFELSFRKPGWADKVNIKDVDSSKISLTGNIYTISKTWKKGDKVTVNFEREIEIHKDNRGDQYISYGPLVYALSIPAKQITYKTYDIEGFKDSFFEPKGFVLNYRITDGTQLNFNSKDFFSSNPWKSSSITGKFWNPIQNEEQEITLVPMGGTILRQVTFPAKN